MKNSKVKIIIPPKPIRFTPKKGRIVCKVIKTIDNNYLSFKKCHGNLFFALMTGRRFTGTDFLPDLGYSTFHGCSLREALVEAKRCGWDYVKIITVRKKIKSRS